MNRISGGSWLGNSTPGKANAISSGVAWTNGSEAAARLWTPAMISAGVVPPTGARSALNHSIRLTDASEGPAKVVAVVAKVGWRIQSEDRPPTPERGASPQADRTAKSAYRIRSGRRTVPSLPPLQRFLSDPWSRPYHLCGAPALGRQWPQSRSTRYPPTRAVRKTDPLGDKPGSGSFRLVPRSRARVSPDRVGE